MKVEFEGETYVVAFTHNTLDNFLKNLNIKYGNSKMGIHSATGKDLQQSKYRKGLKNIFRPLMKHFKYELGTFCIIRKWEPRREQESPSFMQEDPIAFEFTRLSKKDAYFKKKGRSEAIDKAMVTIFPDSWGADGDLDPEIKRKRRAFKKAIMAACHEKGKKKEQAVSALAESK